MHIDFKALTIDLTDDIRDYAQEKVDALGKLLAHTDEDSIRADVELAKKQDQQSGDIFRADVTIHAGGDRTHAVGHGESIRAAIDEAKDELSRRLRREKGKKHDMFVRGAAKIKQMMRFWE